MLFMFVIWYFVNSKYAGHSGFRPITMERCCYFVVGQLLGWATAELIFLRRLRQWRLVRRTVREFVLAYCASLKEEDVKEWREKGLLG